MKSLYRLISVFIFIFSAIYVFKHEKYTKRIGIIDGYPAHFSVNRGQDLAFFLNAQINHKKGIVCIYNAKNQIVDSVTLDLYNVAKVNDTMLFEHGYQYKQKYFYNTAKLKSGLYFLGNIVPFLVKEPDCKSNITIVFPYANFMALTNVGGKSFAKENSTQGIPAEKLSLHRLPYLRNSPSTFLIWVDSLIKDKPINIISDLDLEEVSNLSNTKLLVFYGFQSFWTLKAKHNLDEYINKGGYVLAMCNKLINNQIKYDETNQQIMFDANALSFNNQYQTNLLKGETSILPNYKSLGCSYELYCDQIKTKESFGGYKIIKPQHFVFKGIKNQLVNIDTKDGNAVQVIDCDFVKYPIIDQKFYAFEKSVVLAFDYSIINNKQKITGIFNFKKSVNSGEIIVIGNENWTWPENLKKRDISKITHNCIEYLYSLPSLKTL